MDLSARRWGAALGVVLCLGWLLSAHLIMRLSERVDALEAAAERQD